MKQTGLWSRRMFLQAAGAAPAAYFALSASAEQTAPAVAAGDVELALPSVAGAPPWRILGRRIFNCYKYLANIALDETQIRSSEEARFARAAVQLERLLNPFDRGLHRYFEAGMVEAGTEAELLAGLERQARLYATGVSSAVNRALENYEKEIWPRHRALIAEALPALEKHFGSEQERLVATVAAQFGFKNLPPQLTASLVVPRGLRESSSHPIVLSLTALHGSDLIERMLEEMIHELASENAEGPDSAEALLEDALSRKGLSRPARLRLVSLFESWAAGALVRERVDPEHVPTPVRHGEFESLARAYNLKLSETLLRTIWTNYVAGKASLPAALRQFVDALY